MTHPKAPEDIKALLDGPVNSIPTPFLADGQIDLDGFRSIIEVGISGGSAVSLLQCVEARRGNAVTQPGRPRACGQSWRTAGGGGSIGRLELLP